MTSCDNKQILYYLFAPDGSLQLKCASDETGSIVWTAYLLIEIITT